MDGLTTYTIPVEPTTVSQLLALWTDAFGEWDQESERVLAGSERAYNCGLVFAVLCEGAIAAAAETTQPLRNPTLGTLGEVATWPRHRQQGIGTAVVEAARDRFFADGGQALFLGTENAAAERLYRRLGWERPEAGMMVNLGGGATSPNEFIADYFSGVATVERITAGNASARACLPVLAVAPHPWRLLDANVPLHSTRQAPVRRCSSLLVQYERLALDGTGAWFEGRDRVDRLIGVATARDLGRAVRVDTFAHARTIGAASALLDHATQWARDCGRDVAIVADVAVVDADKRALFERMGFHRPRGGPPIEVAGTSVPSTRLLAPP